MSDDRLASGLKDEYHGLSVGPCPGGVAPGDLSGDTVYEISASGFDCPYDVWAERFRAAALAARPFVLPPGVAPGVHATPLPGTMPVLLADLAWVEPRPGGWAVVHDGFTLVDAEDPTWSDDGFSPALFATADAATAAYHAVRRFEAERQARREDALRSLSLPAGSEPVWRRP